MDIHIDNPESRNINPFIYIKVSYFENQHPIHVEKYLQLDRHTTNSMCCPIGNKRIQINITMRLKIMSKTQLLVYSWKQVNIDRQYMLSFSSFDMIKGIVPSDPSLVRRIQGSGRFFQVFEYSSRIKPALRFWFHYDTRKIPIPSQNYLQRIQLPYLQL